MFNLGLWEIFILAAVALIVVGPEKLPKLARDAARFINEIKRTTGALTQEMNKAMDEKEFQNAKLDDSTDNSKNEDVAKEELAPEDPLADLQKAATEDKFDV